MPVEKRIGKIRSCSHGLGGHQDAMLGYSFDLGGEGWGVHDFWGAWAERPKGARWTLEDQVKNLGEAMLRVRDTMADAGVGAFADLKGKPIEVTLENNTLKSWRILKEAL